MKIVMKHWNVFSDKDGVKIGGMYEVKNGSTVVASASFNSGYGSTEIPLPVDLVADALKLDERVRKAIEDYFAS